MQKEKLRIDKYLWAIRIFKTRSLASEACDSGKVKCNGESVKPSRNVHINDEFEIKTASRKWKIRVSQLLFNRMQHKEAINYYTDITPAEEKDRIQFEAAVFHTGKRLSKLGRPTKKNKRDLDEFLSEN
jgi:ribosome-associated heat shock protein Hsp15